MVLFVRLRDGLVLDDTLRLSIKQQIRQNTTARHVPAVIEQVPDIPKTGSGKIIEVAVRDLLNGKPVKNPDSISNPESLIHFKQCFDNMRSV